MTEQPSHAGAEAYSAWAERLRQKRAHAQQTINGSTAADTRRGPDANWRTENLYTESQRVADSGKVSHRDPVELSAAYAVLEIEAGSSLESVDAQYRRLAKRHHPDRFIGADEATQREHAESFRSISTARDVIRQAHGVF